MKVGKMTEAKRDPSAVVVPFGKHKGATVAELLTQDPQYAEWLLAQGWIAERFAELHAAIMTRGAGTDDTPEHNALQVRFLDPVFCAAFVLAANPAALGRARERADRERRQSLADALVNAENALKSHRYRCASSRWDEDRKLIKGPMTDGERARDAALAQVVESASRAAANPTPLALQCGVQFEQRGIDVVISAVHHSGNFTAERALRLAVEIKPTMGDDFPTVMRQMQRLGADLLLLGEYSGRSVSLPDLRRMFQANGQGVVTVLDVGAELASARSIVASSA
jgi:hypothetical protein